MTTPPIARVSSDLEPLIPKYLHNRHLDIEKASRMLLDNEMEPIRIIGHTLKGNGASYGFPYISELGLRIEDAAQKNDNVSIDVALKELQVYLETVQIVFVEE
jgi:HPt (histidine-containing phosphotransfer) domain-containing protein